MLTCEDVVDRRRQSRRVFELGCRLAITHRSAGIEITNRAQRSLFVIFGNIETIRPSQYAPIDVTMIITADISAMLAKLNAGTFDRAFLLTRGLADHDFSRT